MTDRERTAGTVTRVLVSAEGLAEDIGELVAASEGRNGGVATRAMMSRIMDIVRMLQRMKYEIGTHKDMHEETTHDSQ